jgi:hypothetical protein
MSWTGYLSDGKSSQQLKAQLSQTSGTEVKIPRKTAC